MAIEKKSLLSTRNAAKKAVIARKTATSQAPHRGAVVSAPVKYVLANAPHKLANKLANSPIKLANRLANSPIKLANRLANSPVKLANRLANSPVKLANRLANRPI